MKPFFRIMNLNLLFMLLLTLSASADIKAQNITLFVKGESLETVLSKISNQTNYKFMYDDELISKISEVSIQVKNKDISEVLNQALRNTGFDFEIISGTVVITKKATP